MDDLLPCPFCDSRDIRITEYNLIEDYDKFRYGVTVCEDTGTINFECVCGCTYSVDVELINGIDEKKAYAIKSWNERGGHKFSYLTSGDPIKSFDSEKLKALFKEMDDICEGRRTDANRRRD